MRATESMSKSTDLFGRTREYIEELDLGEPDTRILSEPEPSSYQYLQAGYDGSVIESAAKSALGIVEAKSFFEKDPPPIEWLIEGILEKKNLVMLAGAPKTAKSWLSIEIGLCVATGKALFGDPLMLGNGKKGTVLFCFLEDGAHNIHARVTALARSKGVDDVQGLNMMFRFGGGLDMGNSQHAQQFAYAIRAAYPSIDLIVFDPFRNLHYGDENDSANIIRVMENLRTIRDVTGASVLVIHHTRKPASADKNNPGFAIRGSGAIFGAVDGLIAMNNVDDIEDEITNNVFIRVKAGREAKPFSTSLAILDGPNGRARVARWKVGPKI